MLAGLLRDPLYRYEARRYWTARRYAGAAALLLGWWAVLLWYVFEDRGGFPSGDNPGDMVAIVAGCSILGRMPLSYLAATGAALSIVPERVSGQLEQFVLTPVEPWRFCLARWAGRLRGLFPFWLCTGGGLLVVALCLSARSSAAGGGLLVLLVVAAQIDLAAMLMVDAAVGMRFTSTCRTTPPALIKTFLTSFVLVPFSMYVAALAGGALAGIVAQRVFGLGGGPYYWGGAAAFISVLCGVLVRLGLGAVAVFVSLRDARRAIDKVFYRPGEA